MKIALIGASGFIGSFLRQEALTRGHEVTALVSSPGKLQPAPNLHVVKTDVLESDARTAQIAGHDAVISAFSGHSQSDVRGYYLRGVRSIVKAAKAAGVRLLMVGSGSLDVAPGKQLVDSPDFPVQWKASAEGARDALKLLRGETGLDWTMLSPSAHIEPGLRTGKSRLGSEQLLLGAGGESRIFRRGLRRRDARPAERPQHSKRRFTVGY